MPKVTSWKIKMESCRLSLKSFKRDFGRQDGKSFKGNFSIQGHYRGWKRALVEGSHKWRNSQNCEIS